MPRLFLPNLSFEESRQGRSPGATVRRLEAELALIWIGLAADGDAIACPLPFDPGDWETAVQTLGVSVRQVVASDLEPDFADELVPWGWTSQARKIARRLRIAVSAPEQDVIWICNSREWLFDTASSLSCDLPGSALIRSPEAAASALRNTDGLHGGWIMKTNYGQAARGQLRGSGTELTSQQQHWVRRRLACDGAVVIEPMLNRVAEIGVQWDVPRHGPPRLVGECRLLTDVRGQYLGSRIGAEGIAPSDRAQILRVQELAVRQLQRSGYFGPVGIDAMIHASGEGTSRVRPLQDINARWTMGRLAWEWSQRLGRGGSLMISASPPVAEAVALSPRTLAGAPVRHRLWWMEPAAPSAAEAQ